MSRAGRWRADLDPRRHMIEDRSRAMHNPTIGLVVFSTNIATILLYIHHSGSISHPSHVEKTNGEKIHVPPRTPSHHIIVFFSPFHCDGSIG